MQKKITLLSVAVALLGTHSLPYANASLLAPHAAFSALGPMLPLALDEKPNQDTNWIKFVLSDSYVHFSPYNSFSNSRPVLNSEKFESSSVAADAQTSLLIEPDVSTGVPRTFEPATWPIHSDVGVDQKPPQASPFQGVEKRNRKQVKLEVDPRNRELAPIKIALPGFPRAMEAAKERLSFTTPSLAPMAFVRFCLKYASDCEVRRMAFRPHMVKITEARWSELMQVNREINRAISPEANEGGVLAEEWLVSPRTGDCNDYAVTKRHELLAKGWPSRSLLLTEVILPSGEHHLILVVRTENGDFALDNLNANIRSVSQIRYGWVRAQSDKNPRFWTTVDFAKSDRVASLIRKL
jgi:predicted transglutaminase-like cysteine proteinase